MFFSSFLELVSHGLYEMLLYEVYENQYENQYENG